MEIIVKKKKKKLWKLCILIYNYRQTNDNANFEGNKINF